MALCRVQSATPTHHTRWVKIENFYQERVFRSGPLRQWYPSRNFYPFWAPVAKNYESVFLTVLWPNGAFDRRATKTWVPSFWGAMSKILTRRDFRHLRHWSRKFPSRIFYLLWTTHDQKLVKFGNLTYLVPPQSKRPNRNFFTRAAKMSKKSRGGKFRDHWRQVRERNTLSIGKIRKFDTFGRTLVKKTDS